MVNSKLKVKEIYKSKLLNIVQRRKTWVVLTLLILCTILWNILLSWRVCPPRRGDGINTVTHVLANHNKNPLPNKTKTLLSGSRQRKYAYATLVISDVYMPGAKLLACSLRQVKARYPLVVFVGKSMLQNAIEYYKDVANIQVRPIRIIKVPNYYQKRFGFIFTKLMLFGEEEFDRLIVTDADNTYVKNVDELMTRYLDFGIAMAKINSDNPMAYVKGRAQYSQASANFMVISPNSNILDQMLKLLRERKDLRFEHGFAEQMFFQWYFYLYLNWLPTWYSVTSSEIGAKSNYVRVLHHSRKPFFKMYEGYAADIPKEVRECMKIENISLRTCPEHDCDDMSMFNGTHLPSKADEMDAIKIGLYEK